MIEIQHLTKTFTTAGGVTEALKDVSLTIPDGEIYGIIGMSGAGKSTLVRSINMLERPTSGKIVIDGRDMAALSEAELRAARRDITMIFQGFNLLMQRTCQRNVAFPLELAGMKRGDAMKRAAELLELVGLGDKLKNYPSQLSGGQQQRVAIARALATKPKILLCDEATSALDPQSTQSILGLIRDIHDRLGITVIVITHQMSVVEQICTRVAILDGGEVAEEGKVSEVFAAPQSQAAKRAMSSRSSDSTKARCSASSSTAPRPPRRPSSPRWRWTAASRPASSAPPPRASAKRPTAICCSASPAATRNCSAPWTICAAFRTFL